MEMIKKGRAQTVGRAGARTPIVKGHVGSASPDSGTRIQVLSLPLLFFSESFVVRANQGLVELMTPMTDRQQVCTLHLYYCD